MDRNIVEDLHELQLIALEQRLCQALLAGDHDALGTLVSPALFMMDGQGGRMLDLPWLGEWLAGHLQCAACSCTRWRRCCAGGWRCSPAMYAWRCAGRAASAN